MINVVSASQLLKRVNSNPVTKIFFSSDSGLTCAISDGANESFDSKNWATFVCQEFTNYSQKKTDELKDEDVREMLILREKVL